MGGRGLVGRRARLLAWLAAGALLGSPAGAQQARTPFVDGEKLLYTVRWRLMVAGYAELALQKNSGASGAWKVTAKANSTGYVSNIYKVEDEYRSSFRNPSLCSNGIEKTINEGERHREVSLEFDRPRRLALLRDRDARDGAPPRVAQFSIPDCVHDILSALYYARTQPLQVGQSFEFPVNDGGKTIQIRVDVQAEEEVQTELGTFQAIRVEPDLFSGNVFQGKGRLFVWFTKDASRLPVQLKAQIGVGTITASLSKMEREQE